MREIRSRSFYCRKHDETVTLIEYVRGEPGCEGVSGILSCSHQEFCPEGETDEGEPIFPWAKCPACLERRSEK
jgi:hypothetical protein